MLFNSLHFLGFFIVVTAIYFLLAHKYRWMFLLAASCYFYMVFVPIYIVILGFTIVIDYVAGIWIENSQGKKRKLFLVFSLVANLGILCFFKYYNFLNDNLSYILNGLHQENPVPYLSILLPIGLSFHTFQAMSYTIEVYRGNQAAERHFGIYALYVLFYPQLVAGPIERPQNLLPQFFEKKSFDYDRIVTGLKLMAWGLFKKVVIADRLARVVDHIYDQPQGYEGLTLIIASFFFSFQIYCDFSGYSDIAIGAARIMGFKLMKNFDAPYQSPNIHEFWKRWHISLSTWFKDYLYISLGGSKVTIPRWYLNLFIVFVISGLWHGANWTFIIWGVLHGLFIIFYHLIKGRRQPVTEHLQVKNVASIRAAVQISFTFILVTIGWVFFRANTVKDAFYVLQHAITGLKINLSAFMATKSIPLYLGISHAELLACLLLIVGLEVIQYYQRRYYLTDWLNKQPTLLRWSVYYIGVFLIIFCGVYEDRQFIYFQF